MQRVDINATLKLTQGQGHKVKDQGCICSYIRNCLGYKSGTDDCIFIKIIHSIYIYAMLKLTQGQGHKVKGQGQICRYVKSKDFGYKS